MRIDRKHIIVNKRAMNTTTITITWENYDGFRSAIQAIGNSTVNTFEAKTDDYSIEAISNRIRYSPESQQAAMEFFGCFKSTRVERELCYTRFLIWRYCWTKFDITTTQIAKVTGHNRSNISIGLKKISELLETTEVKELRNKVYAKCDEIFK